MSTLSVTLPDPIQAHINDRVAAGAYPSASEYIQSLIRTDIQAQRQVEMEDKVQEGLDELARGEGAEMTPGDWSYLHQELLDRHRKRKSQCA